MTLRDLGMVAAGLLGGVAIGYVASSVTEPARVVRFCDLPGVECRPLAGATAEVQAELAELILCCSYYDGECSIAEMMSDCNPQAEYIVVCDWGRTLRTGEVECYD